MSIGLPGPFFCGDNRVFGRGLGYGGHLHRAPSALCAAPAVGSRGFVFCGFFVGLVLR